MVMTGIELKISMCDGHGCVSASTVLHRVVQWSPCVNDGRVPTLTKRQKGAL